MGQQLFVAVGMRCQLSDTFDSAGLRIRRLDLEGSERQSAHVGFQKSDGGGVLMSVPRER